MQEAHTQIRWSVNGWAVSILRDHIIGLHFINNKIDGKKY